MSIGSKTLTIYFKDGVENGRLKCQLSNWDGVAYKIPRTYLKNCKNDNEPRMSSLSEEDEDRVNGFIDKIKLV